jgi:hypothetical protein
MLRSRKLWLLALTLSAATLTTPARAAEIDKLTPADAQMVMVFNIRQAIDSPLAKKKGVVDILKAAIDGNPQAKELLKALNLDPAKDIESVAVAVENLTDIQPGGKPDKLLVMVRGNFDPDRIVAVASKLDTIKTSTEGTTTVFEYKDKGKDDTTFFTVIGKDTIAAAPSKAYLLKCVKNIGGGSKDLVKASAKLDSKSSMWLAMVISKEMRALMAQNPQFKDIANKLESVTFGVNVTDAIVADLNINTTDAAAAKAMKAQVDLALPFLTAIVPEDNPANPVVKEIRKNLKVTANQDALNFNLKINEATLDMIIKLAQMNK